MSALVKKEVRLLLPAWCAAMLLAVVPCWIVNITSYLDYPDILGDTTFWLGDVIPGMFALGILLLSISSFGQEFNFGTFTASLSQPVERSRVWRIKIAVLITGFLSVWIAVVLSIWCQFFLHDIFYESYNYQFKSARFNETVVSLTLFGLTVFSGGLWTVLLLRQIAGTFWFALLTPLAVVLGISSLLNDRIASGQSIKTIIMVALSVYSFTGFFGAAILFRRCQDVQWADREISFSRLKEIAGRKTVRLSFRPHHWFSALLWKEIQLHQVSLLIAALVLVLNVGSAVLRKIHPHFNNPNLNLILESIWILWLLIPPWIGCATVAEERRLNVIESQLCLPVSRRFQFFLKFFVGLILSIILGAVMPSIIEETRDFGVAHWIYYWIFIAASLSFFITFYASTFVRSALQAFGVALVIPVIAGSVLWAFLLLFFHLETYDSYDELDSKMLCVVLFWAFILPFVFLGLMYWNFKWLRQGWKLFCRNLVVFSIAIVVVSILAHVVYYRPWEWLMSAESSHGPARLSPKSSIQLINNSEIFAAILPDGKLWCAGFDYSSSPVLNYLTNTTDWQTAVPGNSSILGIHSDGTLWLMDFSEKYKPADAKPPNILTQIGTETNWAAVANQSPGFLLLKKNGTLWIWGTNDNGGPFERIKAAKAEPPMRINDDTNWVKLYSPVRYSGFAQKNDGSLWKWSMDWDGTNHLSHFMLNTNWNTQWTGCVGGYGWAVAIKTNGELWLFYHLHTDWDKAGIAGFSRKIELDANSSWKAVSMVQPFSCLLLKSDGTLWKWKIFKTQYSNMYINEENLKPEPFKPIQLGHYSDWIGLSSDGWSTLAVSGDGSIWSWDHLSRWLAPSRRPVYLGNILQGAEKQIP